MLNHITKTMPWMVASFLVATSGFGQQCPPPKPKPQCCEPVKCEKVCPPVCPVQLIPAYNQTAAIDTRCSWDIWADASFTYWQASQDNLEIGIADSELNANLPGATFSQVSNGNVIDMGFKFKPGFKVGAGVKFDHDDWDAHAEYTWFRSTINTSSDGPASTDTTTGFIIPTVGSPFLQASAVYGNVSAKWRCNMDIVDATMGRWYYVGKMLKFHPYAGARGQWIRQKFNVTYDAPVAIGAQTQYLYTSNNHSNSWAVGPEMGLDMSWEVGEGFRFYSCGEVDVLFTRYTTSRNSDNQTNVVGTPVATPFAVTQHHINRLRAHMDLEMGLGWGTYLDCNNWYLDLAAGYGFQVFWDQNMFRTFVDDSMVGKSFAPNGNLYIQGLTATVSLHF